MVLRYHDFDILAITETFLRGDQKLDIDGYTFIGHNRDIQQSGVSRRGSGGVGILVKKDLFHEFQIDILDQSVDGMLWITVKNPNCCFNICVCYLPPENSKYCDTLEFFAKLLEKVYVYQNMGPLYLMGDYNARCGDCSDYIEDVDDVIPREVLDTYCNRNGDALIDMLIDCNMCMVNGRVGNQDFTSISTKGKSVVDYVLAPHEQLHTIKEFSVHTVSEMTNYCGLQGNTKVPDHSLLDFCIYAEEGEDPERVPSSRDGGGAGPKPPRRFKCNELPDSFLHDDDTIVKINETLQWIQDSIDRRDTADTAYRQFTQLIVSEMECKLKQRVTNNSTKMHKTSAKPYWNDHLAELWKKCCSA